MFDCSVATRRSFIKAHLGIYFLFHLTKVFLTRLSCLAPRPKVYSFLLCFSIPVVLNVLSFLTLFSSLFSFVICLFLSEFVRLLPTLAPDSSQPNSYNYCFLVILLVICSLPSYFLGNSYTFNLLLYVHLKFQTILLIFHMLEH